MTGTGFMDTRKQNNWLLYHRWPWHVLFWIGYILFRFWLYYITVNYYPTVFLEYMLLSEVLLVAGTYFTLWLYRRFFLQKKYVIYFLLGAGSWLLYLYARTVFQFYYLRHEPAFQNNKFSDIFINNITFVLVYFIFITACKYGKDGYIAQQFDAEKKQQQLRAEVHNLKSQIAPHFLFNTLNNLYGLAIDKSDKLPGLMLRLSDLLRHSLYETQKPMVPITDEIEVLKSYVELERVRLEDDLQLDFVNSIPKEAPYQIAPLILIVFMENAFKHAKFIKAAPVTIDISTTLEEHSFQFTIRNNYNEERAGSTTGIGLANVRRRLELLYPNGQHQLTIIKDAVFYTVYLQLQLMKTLETTSNNGA